MKYYFLCHHFEIVCLMAMWNLHVGTINIQFLSDELLVYQQC